jgi:apolipoprotein N-acyltransferase
MSSQKIKTIFFISLAAFFLLFTNGRWNFALAAWLYPLFMLRVSRNHKPLFSLFVISFIVSICYLVSTWKMTPFGAPNSILFYLPALGFGIVIGFIFYIDRIIYKRLNSFVVTLFFPLLYTIIDFIISRNPLGSWGMIGYTQTEFLSFSQLASITGMCGLTFMITWFGSVLNWAYDNYIDKKLIFRSLLFFLIPFLLITVYGSIRITQPLEKGTVRIAGIHVADKYKEGNKMWQYIAHKNYEEFKKLSDTITNHLIANTVKESVAGAKIVEWSEVSPYILKSEFDGMIGNVSNLAKQLDIYIVLTPFIYESDSTRPENKVMIIDPMGHIILTHYKYGGSFIEGTVTGNKIIPTVPSAFGNLSAIICWDADFPSTVKQVGISNTDILFIPSADWKEIDPVHGQMAIFRAIENGCSVVRESQAGWSMMVDPRGKLICSMDHYQSNSWSMVGNVPYKKLFTLYPYIGDLFGWLSALFFAVLVGFYRKLLFKKLDQLS